MSQFACISFEEDNILVSKEKSFKYPHRQNRFVIEAIKGFEGVWVKIYKSFKKSSTKYWHQLEKELLLKDVTHVFFKEAQKQFNPFQHLEVITGDEIRPLLASMMLHYIYKYHLIEVKDYETKVGIITGRVYETLDLIANIKDEITDLTLYTKEPLEYKEVVQALNKRLKLRVKALPLQEQKFDDRHIIFDLNGTGDYVLKCNPKSIYIDYKNQTNRYIKQFTAPLPRIWYEFEIIYRSRSVSVPFLQALFYTQGLTHGLLRKEIKHLDLTLGRVYERRIS